MEKEELEAEKIVEVPKTTNVPTKKAKEVPNLHKIAIDVHNDGHGFYDNEKRMSLLNEGYTANQVHDIMNIANGIK